MQNQPNAVRVSKRLKNPLVLLLIAAVLAMGVAWITLQYLERREAAMKAELAASGQANAPRRIAVAVPMADAGVGTVLSLDTFVARPVEEDLVYPDTVLASDFMSMQGMKLARPVLRGRPLRVTDLQVPEVRDVAAVLPAGRRALTIEIDNVNSIAQTLRPNHRIDIYLLSKIENQGAAAGQGAAKGYEQVSLYMQDMVVLATGTEFADVTRTDGPALDKMVRPGEIDGRRDGDYDTVTLLVTPEQAARLMVGQKLGSYRVVLRGEQDRTQIAQRTLRGIDVMGGAPRARDAGIEFIVGGGGDKLISELAQAPSQDARAAVQRARSQATPSSPPRAAPAQAAPAQVPLPGRTTLTISAPTTRADQVIAQRKQ
ncbi:Flp pilus assembly protein CpaB [Massilia consociata]|uniref:Flp pilus assembly protein CpaB n=1 Tax=Massilia consociata TaxID=760117 RepID=A0ABV6FK59_9BURK